MNEFIPKLCNKSLKLVSGDPLAVIFEQCYWRRLLSLHGTTSDLKVIVKILGIFYRKRCAHFASVLKSILCLSVDSV